MGTVISNADEDGVGDGSQMAFPANGLEFAEDADTWPKWRTFRMAVATSLGLWALIIALIIFI